MPGSSTSPASAPWVRSRACALGKKPRTTTLPGALRSITATSGRAVPISSTVTSGSRRARAIISAAPRGHVKAPT